MHAKALHRVYKPVHNCAAATGDAAHSSTQLRVRAGCAWWSGRRQLVLTDDNGSQFLVSISAFKEPLRPTVCVGGGVQNSVVGVATRYGSAGRGIESR